MASEKHLSILRQGVKIWNSWREENPSIKPDLSEANLIRADLGGAYLRETDLTRANLSAADLRESNLSRSDLSGADLGWANLREADLSGADLSRADLSEADLWKANIERAKFEGAKLEKAVFVQTNLTYVADLTQEQIDLAIIDKTSQLPDYLRSA